MIDDSYAVAEAFRFFDVMRGHDDGFLFALEFFDNVVNFAAHLGVETGGGLVEEQHLRIVYQRQGQGQALFLSARELAVEGVTFFLQAEAL